MPTRDNGISVLGEAVIGREKCAIVGCCKRAVYQIQWSQFDSLRRRWVPSHRAVCEVHGRRWSIARDLPAPALPEHRRPPAIIKERADGPAEK